MGSTFFASFIAGDTPAAALLPGRCTDAEAWAQAGLQAGRRRVSTALLDELRRQSALLPPSEARERRLAALGAGGASVVVTGQQVGLFLGPLYTLHKAATAVARARLVQERTGRPCIPLFWLQTEDHDWAEIASAEVLAGERRRLALPDEPPELARVSLAQRALPPEVDGLVEQLGAMLAPLHHGKEVAALVARHYRSGVPPGAAFAGVLAELFAEQGLLIFDPRTPAVAALARPVLRRALEEHAAIAAALSGRRTQLEACGFEEQVRTREAASLVFFHPRGPAGPRYRLVREADGWSTPEGKVALGALLERLEAEPLAFSTSALLRPLVQDSLWPTCAFLGGPAECTYFAQLPPVYEVLGLPLPLVAPRARLRVVDEAARALLDKLGLRPEDADLPRAELLARTAGRPPGLPGPAELKARLLAGLEQELDRLGPLCAGLDPQLEGPLRKTRESAQQAVSRLAERIDKAALGRDQVAAERLDRLLGMLRPDGEPQERVLAFPGLAARCGPRALVAALVEAAASLDPAPRSVLP